MEYRNPGAAGAVIHRKRLTSVLAAVTQGKLALITAPGGYGKSTVIHELAAATPGATFCWLTLDPADVSLPIFLHQLARAVARHLPPGGLFGVALDRAPTDEAAVRHLGRLVASELGQHAEERLVIILDDLHHVTVSDQVMTFLEALVRFLPDTVHLIMASRLKPGLPLARLEARGELVHLTAQDLSFTRDEASQLLEEHLGRPVPDRVLDILMEQTEGWVTALILTAKLLKVTPHGEWESLLARSPGEGALFDFLAEEVLSSQPPDVQEFLLTTSVLRCLQPYVVERLMSCKGVGSRLSELEAQHLFLLRMPNRTISYRYHHLFHAFLRRQLVARKGEGEARRLNAEAGRIHESMGNLVCALEHYLSAASFTQAAVLMADQVDTALKSMRQEMVRSWLEQVPAELHDEDPNLVYVRAQLAGWGSQAEVLPALYQRCIELYEQRGDYRGLARTLSWVVQRFWKLRQAYFYESPARWAIHPDAEVRTYGRMLLAIGRSARGQWAEAFADLESLLGTIPAATRAYFDCLETLTLVAFWRGDPASVKQYGIPQTVGRTALGDFAWGIYNWVCFLLLADPIGLDYWHRQYITLEVQPAMSRMHQLVGILGQGLVHLYHRRWEDALASFESLIPYLGDHRVGFRAMGSDATFMTRQELAGLYIRFGRREEARACLEHNLELAAAYPELGVMAYVGMACFLLEEGDLPGARRYLAKGQAADPPGIEGLTTIALAVAGSRIALAEGDREAARRWLAQAVLLVRQRGCAWYLLNRGGPEVLPALVDLARQTLPGGLPGQVVFEVIGMMGEQAAHCLAPYLSHADAAVRSSAFTLLDQAGHGRMLEQVPSLKIYTMGPLRVYRSDQPAESPDWKRNKVKLLLAILLLRRGKPIAKDAVTELFWPEAPPATARANLRATLHGLKRTLEPELEVGASSRFIRADRDTLCLDGLDQIWTDLWEFDDLIGRARAAQRSRRSEEATQLFEAACNLGRGSFLPEPAFADHFQEVRTRVEQAYLNACLEVAVARVEAGDYREAIDAARRALLVDRATEDAYQVLIRAYLALGDRERAMQTYKLCQKHMRRLLGSEPSAHTHQLLEA